MASMEYELATHAGSGLVRHTLQDDRLVIFRHKGERRQEIDFADIRQVNLRMEMSGIYSIRITPKSGNVITVPARHFEGLGRFEERYEAYTAFAHKLHQAVYARNPGVVFSGGSSIFYWLGWAFLVFGVLFGAIIAYALVVGFEGKAPPRMLYFIAPLLFLVGGGFVKQGGTKRYPPDALPLKLLPPQPLPS